MPYLRRRKPEPYDWKGAIANTQDKKPLNTQGSDRSSIGLGTLVSAAKKGKELLSTGSQAGAGAASAAPQTANMGAWMKGGYEGFKGGQYAAAGGSAAGGIASGVGAAAGFAKQLITSREAEIDEAMKDNPFYAGANMEAEKLALEMVQVAAAIGVIALSTGPVGWVGGALALGAIALSHA